MRYYYLDYIEDGRKRGPISAGQLSKLAQLGIISRDTVIIAGEHEMKAGEIEGLTFDLPPEDPKRKTLTEWMEAKTAELEAKAAAAAATRGGKLTLLGWNILFRGLLAAVVIAIIVAVIQYYSPEDRKKREILDAAHAAVSDDLGQPDPLFFSSFADSDVREWEEGHVNVSFKTSSSALGWLTPRPVTVRLQFDGTKWVPEYPIPVTILDD